MQKKKRTLALFLAVTMLVSLLAIQVSAANTTNTDTIATATSGTVTFSDKDKISNLTAVESLVSLGIINGMPDGTFSPTTTVTRAQMAKMIYVLRNGGVDDGAAGYPTAGFTDTANNWAKNYIDAVVSAGIVAGLGDGTFQPDKDVTATECYKMLLVVIGYDANKAGLVGANWASNTLRLATDAGLTTDISTNVSVGMQRQLAAQAIYNCIDSYRVKVDNGEYVEYAKTDADPTVGEKYLGLKTVTGLYLGNHEFSVDGTTASEGYIKVAVIEDGQLTGSTLKIKSDAGLELIGQQIKVHYKQAKNSTTNVAYGLYTSGDSKIEPFSVIDDYKYDDLQTKSSAKAIVFANGEKQEDTTIADAVKNSEFPIYANLTLINNDGLKDENGKTSAYNAIALVTVPAVVKVNTYSSKLLTFSNAILTGDYTGSTHTTKKSFTLTDSAITYDLPSKLAVDDVVLAWYNTMGDVLHVTKAASVSGKVDGLKDKTDTSVKARIDGTYYKYVSSGDYTAYPSDDDLVKFSAIKTDNSYTLYLCNGFFVAAKKTSGSGSGASDNYAVVKGAYTVGEDLKLKLVLDTGTTATYTVGRFFDEKVSDLSSTELSNLYGTIQTLIENKGLLVTYELSDSTVNISAASDAKDIYTVGNLGISSSDAKNYNDYAIENSYTVSENGTTTGALFFKDSTASLKNAKYAAIDTGAKAIDSNASVYLDTDVVCFFQKDGDWHVSKFADLGDDIKWSELGNANVVAVRNSDDNVIALMVANGSYKAKSDSSMQYGYLVDAVADNGDDLEFSIWTGSEVKTYKMDEALSTITNKGIKKHSIVAYDLTNDGMIDDIYLVMDSLTTADKDDYDGYTVGYGEITSVSGTRVKINLTYDETGKTYTDNEISCKTTKDSVLMTVNTDKSTGVDTTTALSKNNKCIVIVNDDDEIVFCVIDVNGYFYKEPNFSVANNNCPQN